MEVSVKYNTAPKELIDSEPELRFYSDSEYKYSPAIFMVKRSFMNWLIFSVLRMGWEKMHRN